MKVHISESYEWCPFCLREGKKVKAQCKGVYSHRAYVDEFTDDDGKLHIHDTNKKCVSFECEFGHKFGYMGLMTCEQGCGWPLVPYTGSVNY